MNLRLNASLLLAAISTTSHAQPITINSVIGSVSAEADMSCFGAVSCGSTTTGTSGMIDLLVNPTVSYGVTTQCGFPPPRLPLSISAVGEGAFTINSSSSDSLAFTTWGSSEVCSDDVYDTDCDVDTDAGMQTDMTITCVTDVKVFGHLIAGLGLSSCDSVLSFSNGAFSLSAGGSSPDTELINHVFPAGTVITIFGSSGSQASGNARVELDGCMVTCTTPIFGTGYEIDAEFEEYCLPDTNKNGSVEPGDFTAWTNAYNNGDLLVADQNGDGQLTSGDFTAFLANYSRGCPW